MGRPLREVYGVELTADEGASRRTAALCEPCILGIDGATTVTRGTLAGVRCCDWCGAINAAECADGEGHRTRPIILRNESNWTAGAASIGELMAKDTISGGDVQNLAAEDLPTRSVMLEVEYSPVIPFPFGKLETAVEVEKINDYAYRYEYRSEVYTVSDEQLKEMRARYLVAHGEKAKEFMRLNNPEGSVWHRLGKT